MIDMRKNAAVSQRMFPLEPMHLYKVNRLRKIADSLVYG